VVSITLQCNHTLSENQALEIVNGLKREMKNDYGIQSRWVDSTLRFDSRGLNGELRLEAGRISITIRLALMLAPLKRRIETEVGQRLREEIDRVSRTNKTDPH
jgi:putative polyhydroxyalkanoate system protein